MKARTSYFLYQLRTGFWFVPTLITLAAITMAQLAAFNEIRQAAPGNVAVVARMVEALTRVAAFAAEPSRQNAIRRAYRDAVPEPNDRQDIERRFAALETALAG